MQIEFKSFSKEKRFEELCHAIGNCKLCSRLINRRRVFSTESGNIYSKILFVAEAPGRFGADRTGIPLLGDKTGDNFDLLLNNISWSRKDIFITNAVLCNPREENGNNDLPTINEIKNCLPFLNMTIELVQPVVVVSLGKVALTALGMISPISIDLRKDVGRLLSWSKRRLVPLYHPSPRALIHRSLANQRADFIRLSKYVDPKYGLKKKKILKYTNQKSLFEDFAPSRMQNIIFEIITALGKISYFKLTKLLFLIDLLAVKRLGRSLSDAVYLRREEGPWPPDLKDQINKLKNKEIVLSYHGGIPILEPRSSSRFQSNLNKASLDIIYEIIGKYGDLNDSRLKTVIYLTEPMRYILRQEKLGKDMRNKPIIYKNRLVGQLEGD